MKCFKYIASMKYMNHLPREQVHKLYSTFVVKNNIYQRTKNTSMLDEEWRSLDYYRKDFNFSEALKNRKKKEL